MHVVSQRSRSPEFKDPPPQSTTTQALLVPPLKIAVVTPHRTGTRPGPVKEDAEIVGCDPPSYFLLLPPAYISVILRLDNLGVILH